MGFSDRYRGHNAPDFREAATGCIKNHVMQSISKSYLFI